MNRSFIIGAALGFTLGAITAGYAKAETPTAQRIPPAEVEHTAEIVRAYLYLAGYERPSPALPPTYRTKLNGYAGLTIAGTIVVNSDQPEACTQIIIAHEYVHFILGSVYGKHPKQSEETARQVERIVSPDYLPNCEAPL